MTEPSGPGDDADAASVLLIDDDPKILSVLGRALTSATIRVTSVSSGAEALSLLASEAFDAVVSDIQMPGISGLKLLRTVREYDLDLPIVLMTGQPNLSGAATAVEYGALQYLIKPVAIDRLRAIVGRAVGFGRILRLKRQCATEYGSGSFYVGDRAGIEAKLDRALQSLWMAYQPIVHADGAAFAYEAFLRSDEAMLPHPGAVLMAAERLRRIPDVGRAVRDLVAAEVNASADGTSLVFVNLHPEDLLDPLLYLPSAPLSRLASRVVLELTDRAPVDDIKDVAVRIRRLRELGYRIAVDDLGAGEAGLATLSQLEPEFVKLDISLIRDIHSDPTKRKIASSLVQLCHTMGKAIIAEGVEREEERAVLVAIGCDHLQGFLFGRPGPLYEAGRELSARGAA
jgi:EAL domain-containing protein (putative c-di-GMP-specific phosphodiesterase class I)/ActR/RegA family two-component response regulator